jgi:hypothetical protein
MTYAIYTVNRFARRGCGEAKGNDRKEMHSAQELKMDNNPRGLFTMRDGSRTVPFETTPHGM